MTAVLTEITNFGIVLFQKETVDGNVLEINMTEVVSLLPNNHRLTSVKRYEAGPPAELELVSHFCIFLDIIYRLTLILENLAKIFEI